MTPRDWRTDEARPLPTSVRGQAPGPAARVARGAGQRRLALALSALSLAFIGGGIALLLYVVALQHDALPIGDFTLPQPVALDDADLMEEPLLALADEGEGMPPIGPRSSGSGNDENPPAPSLGSRLLTLLSSVASPPAPPSAIRPQGPEILEGPLPPPGVGHRLSIPAIGLSTAVVGAAAVPNDAGELEWQTLPFVAVHYANDTGLVGSRGNPVLAGHVVTLSQGNVFRDLYRVQPGDRVFVQTQDGNTFAYQVSRVRLVDPSDVEVMASTSDAAITLITCAGTYDSRTRSFSKRLVVVGSLVGTVAL